MTTSRKRSARSAIPVSARRAETGRPTGAGAKHRPGLLVLLALLLLACSPDRTGPDVRRAPECADGPAPSGPVLCPLPPCELVFLLKAARRAAAPEMAAIALALPPGSRDCALSWLLARAGPEDAGAVIGALERPEIARFQEVLLRLGASSEASVRDPALLALARAGVLDVQPLVSRALRIERSERSLVSLAAAAGMLGALLPVEAIETALARAKTNEALLALVEALGPALGADAVRIVASRGRGPALDRALALLRGSPPAAQPLRPAPSAPTSSDALALLHARAHAIAAADAERERAALAALAASLGAGGTGAASAAAALGAVGSRDAAVVLASALFETHGDAASAIGSALAAILQVAPERSPAGARELRAAWMPIVATLLPEANARASGDT